MIQLSSKDIQFTIEAIDNLINTYEKNVDREDINEDEAADLGNDCMFLESLRHKLAKNLESDLAESQPSLSLISQKLSSQELIIYQQF